MSEAAETQRKEKAPKTRPIELDTGAPTIGVGSVAWLLGLSETQVRRLAATKGSPLNAALVDYAGDGSGKVRRFRRPAVDLLVDGPKATVLPMKARGA